ncbi:MAG: (d)CMP kinase [Clostridia bacterium]|nr:(d)CMP kinase [Clostridia bacterium]
MKHINIALDGPSGAGKSTLAKRIASSMGISYVDTGAIYRTVGYAVRERGIDPSDAAAVRSILAGISVEAVFENGVQKMFLDGEYLGEKIRKNEISAYASKVSAIPEVREFLLETQRAVARRNSVIMDGRDIGTVILPDADIKIFLSADAECRARRRCLELGERGEQVDFTVILNEIKERDARDSGRDTAPLRSADDAVLLDNTYLDLDGTVKAALGIIFAVLERKK